MKDKVEQCSMDGRHHSRMFVADSQAEALEAFLRWYRKLISDRKAKKKAFLILKGTVVAGRFVDIFAINFSTIQEVDTEKQVLTVFYGYVD